MTRWRKESIADSISSARSGRGRTPRSRVAARNPNLVLTPRLPLQRALCRSCECRHNGLGSPASYLDMPAEAGCRRSRP